MILKILSPTNNKNEIQWIIKTIFKDFLGIQFDIEFEDRKNFCIFFNNKKLIINADFFIQFSKKKWLSSETMPNTPLRVYDLGILRAKKLKYVDSNLPVIFGNSEIRITENQINCEIDIIGSAFFMLSRYEECIERKRDYYDRVSAKTSIAYQEGFLQRPIINEYIELLFYLLQRLWPKLERKSRNFRNLISADVDAPYAYSVKSLFLLFKQLTANIFIRRNIRRVFTDILNIFFTKFDIYKFDPFYPNFEWMISENLKNKNQMIFNFIVDCKNKKMDGVYNINEPIIRKLLKKIDKAKLDIGIHFSYESYKDINQMNKEIEIFNEVRKNNCLSIKSLSSRQHILRLDPRKTIRLLNQAGVQFDTSLTYHDSAGFRCGICYEYKMYDVLTRSELSIIIRPLIVMEVTLFNKNYMNLSSDEGYLFMQKMKERCYQFNGDFSLLWHNHFFDKKIYKEIYKKVIKNFI